MSRKRRRPREVPAHAEVESPEQEPTVVPRVASNVEPMAEPPLVPGQFISEPASADTFVLGHIKGITEGL